MKKIFSPVLSLFLLFSTGYSQRIPDPIAQVIATANNRPTDIQINCNPITSSNCNLILNNNFDHIPNYTTPVDPFNMDEIPGWVAPGGSPTVWDPAYFGTWYDPPPPQATSWAFMGVGSTAQLGEYTESVAQKVPQIMAGRTYFLTFYKKRKDYAPHGLGTFPVDFFNIYLFNCSDYTTYFPPNPNWSPPTVPLNSQQIYCETDVVNDVWQRVAIKFTAAHDYDMLWFYPRQNAGLGLDRGSGLYITLPELIDVTNFTAGPFIPGTQPNCVGLIGTTNNCAPTDALFTWYNPANQFYSSGIISQLNIDVTNPANQGTWTLTMTVSGTSFSNNTCSQIATVSAQVTVTNTCNVYTGWPKIYEAVESNGFKIDNNTGNIYSAMYLQDMNNNINHNGVVTSNTGDHFVHYNASTGVTNWISTDWVYGLPLSSGKMNFINHVYPNNFNNIYRNGSTGILVSGPNVPSSAELLAEDNGGFITRDGYNFKSYDPSGNLITTIPIAAVSGYSLDVITRAAIYHPSNHKLFVCLEYYSGSLGYHRRIAVIDFNPSTYAMMPANDPANNQVHGPLVQVNNNTQIYIYDPVNKILEEYNLNGSYYTVSMNNFSNSSLEEVQRYNYLVEDRIIIKNTTLHYFYCINTATNTATKISYTPPSTNSQFYNHYVFYGNDVFISGEYNGTGFSIGNQAFPLLGTGSAFITKFNLSEFTSRITGKNGESEQGNFIVETVLNKENEMKEDNMNNKFGLSLFPNPAKQTLTVTLTQTANKGNSFFFISVTNTAGEKLLTTFSNKYNTELDVSKLKPGLYYVSITTDKRNIVTKAFLKE